MRFTKSTQWKGGPDTHKHTHQTIYILPQTIPHSVSREIEDYLQYCFTAICSLINFSINNKAFLKIRSMVLATLVCIHLYYKYIYRKCSKLTCILRHCSMPVLAYSKIWLLLNLSFLRCHSREQWAHYRLHLFHKMQHSLMIL